MNKSLTEILKAKKKDYENRVELAVEEIAENARDFAPRGPTDQLRLGIANGGVVTAGNIVKGFVVSSAISSGGYEYAGKINDDELNHATPEGGPARKSFIDFALSGNTQSDKYQSGWRIANKYNYATNYLEKGFFAAKKNINIILGMDR